MRYELEQSFIPPSFVLDYKEISLFIMVPKCLRKRLLRVLEEKVIAIGRQKQFSSSKERKIPIVEQKKLQPYCDNTSLQQGMRLVKEK